ncbi:hypothetical protein [Streptomyces sp. NPDC053048]
MSRAPGDVEPAAADGVEGDGPPDGDTALRAPVAVANAPQRGGAVIVS